MIFEKIKDSLASLLEIDADLIKPETDIIDDLGADSLDIAELLTALEDEYGIVISGDEVHEIRTVAQLSDFIDGLLN